MLCDRKVVYASKQEYEPSDEVVDEMETKIGKPCYILTRETIIEEQIGWSDLRDGDYTGISTMVQQMISAKTAITVQFTETLELCQS